MRATHPYATWAAAFVAVLLAFAARADVTLEFDATPRVVRVGEVVTVRISIIGSMRGDAPALPPIAGFDMIGTRSEQNISITPAGQEIRRSFLYDLRANEAGTFQIGPFSYSVEGRVMDLPAIEIRVEPAALGDSGSPITRADELLFARLTGPTNTVYVQQPFDIELRVYSLGVQLDREMQLNGLDTTGLRTESWQEFPASRESVGGQIYDVRLYRTRATALSAGDLTLSAALRVNVITRGNRRGQGVPFGDPFFDTFFGRYQTQPHDLELAPLVLSIRDIPAEGRPASYAAAVGRFTFDVDARPLAVAPGDPITLTYRIAGIGNLDAVSAPQFPADAGFRVYDARMSAFDPQRREKIFEQVVIPRDNLATALPPVEFSFFDPEAGRYETIVRGPFPLELAGGPTAAPAIVQSATPAEPRTTAETLGHDIVYLKPAPERWTRRNGGATLPLAAMHTLPALLFATALLLKIRKDRDEKNPAHVRRRKAPRTARIAMARARDAAKSGSSADFHEAAWQVLAAYFGNRLNLPPGQVDSAHVVRAFAAAGLPEAKQRVIADWFTRCDLARFAGAAADPTAADRARWARDLDQLSDTLRACEGIRL